jgi:hypothetical protein
MCVVELRLWGEGTYPLTLGILTPHRQKLLDIMVAAKKRK